MHCEGGHTAWHTTGKVWHKRKWCRKLRGTRSCAESRTLCYCSTLCYRLVVSFVIVSLFVIGWLFPLFWSHSPVRHLRSDANCFLLLQGRQQSTWPDSVICWPNLGASPKRYVTDEKLASKQKKGEPLVLQNKVITGYCQRFYQKLTPKFASNFLTFTKQHVSISMKWFLYNTNNFWYYYVLLKVQWSIKLNAISLNAAKANRKDNRYLSYRLLLMIKYKYYCSLIKLMKRVY